MIELPVCLAQCTNWPVPRYRPAGLQGSWGSPPHTALIQEPICPWRTPLSAATETTKRQNLSGLITLAVGERTHYDFILDFQGEGGRVIYPASAELHKANPVFTYCGCGAHHIQRTDTGSISRFLAQCVCKMQPLDTMILTIHPPGRRGRFSCPYSAY